MRLPDPKLDHTWEQATANQNSNSDFNIIQVPPESSHNQVTGMFSLTPTRDLPAWTQQGIIRYSLSEDSCHSSVITPLVTHHCTGEKFDIRSANTQNDARLDVSARGVWSAMDKTFLDIRVFNSRAPTNISKPLKSVLIHHEKEKKSLFWRGPIMQGCFRLRNAPFHQSDFPEFP